MLPKALLVSFSILVILALLALIVACSDDSGPGTAPPVLSPTVVTPEPTPTGTPAPQNTAVPATGAPSSPPEPAPKPITVTPTLEPTPHPTPTPRWTLPTPSGPTPTPAADERREADELTAFGFINALSESVRGMTTAFDLQIELAVVQNGQETIVPVDFDGDFQGGSFFGGIPSYSRGGMTLGLPAGQESLEVISVPGRMYVRRESETQWEEIPASVNRTVVPDPRAFVFDSSQATSHLSEIAVVGEELLDGANTVVISAHSKDIEIFGGPGEFDLTYRFSEEDGRLVSVDVLGHITLGGNSLLGPHIESESAALSLKVRFLDQGKNVEILTPELVVGTFSHDALLLDDGRILATGGFIGVANNNTLVPFPVPYAQIFDFGEGLWKPVGGNPIGKETPPVGPDIFNSAVMVPGGSVLVFGMGAAGEEGGSGSVYLLDAGNDTWEFVADGGLQRFGTKTLVLRDGRVLIAGGVDLSGENSSVFGEISPHVEIFDPHTRMWTRAADMPQVGTGPFHEMVVLQDGRVLAMHRDFSNGDQPSAQLYDPLTDKWSFTGAMPRISGIPVAQVLQDGRVLVTDAPAYSSKGYSESFLFYPEANTWESDEKWDIRITHPMNRSRENHKLTLLPDGRVLATGGDDFFEGDAAEVHRGTTEIFDPETDEWTSGPDLEELRSNHTATLLPDGRILLTGGIGLVVEKDEIAPIFTTEFVQP